MKTPISKEQRARALALLRGAELDLVLMAEERLNLDPETRDQLNRTRGALAETERLLLEQPITDANQR
jgi:hypothetical protein